jgi:hypothetical protein
LVFTDVTFGKGFQKRDKFIDLTHTNQSVFPIGVLYKIPKIFDFTTIEMIEFRINLIVGKLSVFKKSIQHFVRLGFPDYLFPMEKIFIEISFKKFVEKMTPSMEMTITGSFN